MSTLRNRILANIRPNAPKTRAVTCEELVGFLKERHQSVSAYLRNLRAEGIIYVAGTRRSASNRNVNAYRLVVDLQEAQAIDSQCGAGIPTRTTRDAVVAYLAACSEAEWNAVLREAAHRALDD